MTSLPAVPVMVSGPLVPTMVAICLPAGVSQVNAEPVPDWPSATPAPATPMTPIAVSAPILRIRTSGFRVRPM